jgi:hypothetical protein
LSWQEHLHTHRFGIEAQLSTQLFDLFLVFLLYCSPTFALRRSQAELSTIRANLALGTEHQGLGWQEDPHNHCFGIKAQHLTQLFLNFRVFSYVCCTSLAG